ncbi:MAG: tRNA (adenosine(37)-N6)-threonylcarbamoyltransferase complex ATPase subunit type 1 TsaE, partial [Nitrospirae bacterium]|nr:tRNA (adenosine(37)-N6)-threonylcarbamoyltransferase complex ATPase subunit type 1 TsaE [Nitrospirota bacterium]
PTFVLIHEYRGRLPLAHADLYRIQTATELAYLGLSEYLDGHTVVAIEWADKAGTELPQDRVEVYLSHRGKTARDLVLQATGARSRDLLARVMKRGRPRKPASHRAVTERAR